MVLRTFTTLMVWGAVVGTPVLARPLGAQRGPAPDVSPYLIADRAAEIRLARTAAPPFISDSATVLVLGRTGYTEATRGTNGFTCVVIRSLGGPLGVRGVFNPHISAPHCFDAPAARTVMPVILKQTEWLLSGESESEVTAHIARGYASKEFSPPAVGAMAYMMSPEQNLFDNGSHALPHLMFFYDKTQAPSVWGARSSDSPMLDDPTGDQHTPFLILFVPVPKWSNGTPIAASSGHH
jgi:hypothetical protein